MKKEASLSIIFSIILLSVLAIIFVNMESFEKIDIIIASEIIFTANLLSFLYHLRAKIFWSVFSLITGGAWVFIIPSFVKGGVQELLALSIVIGVSFATFAYFAGVKTK